MINMHYEREIQSQAESVVICIVLGVYCRSYYLLFIRVWLGIMLSYKNGLGLAINFNFEQNLLFILNVSPYIYIYIHFFFFAKSLY